MRLFERALRRAQLPVKYSQGYNPRPAISFAAPLEVGASSEGELMQMEMVTFGRPGEVRERLQAQMPEGLEVLQVVPAAQEGRSLMARVEGAAWRVWLQTAAGAVEDKSVREAIDRVLAAASLPVERTTPKGTKVKDIRPGIYELRGEGQSGGVSLEMVLAAGSRLHVRPEEVCQQLAARGDLPLKAVRSHRLALLTREREQWLPLG